MIASKLPDSRDRAAAEKVEQAVALLRGRRLPERPLTNWCPDCREYRSDGHPQPCKGAKQ